MIAVTQPGSTVIQPGGANKNIARVRGTSTTLSHPLEESAKSAGRISAPGQKFDRGESIQAEDRSLCVAPAALVFLNTTFPP